MFHERTYYIDADGQISGWSRSDGDPHTDTQIDTGSMTIEMIAAKWAARGAQIEHCDHVELVTENFPGGITYFHRKVLEVSYRDSS